MEAHSDVTPPKPMKTSTSSIMAVLFVARYEEADGLKDNKAVAACVILDSQCASLRNAMQGLPNLSQLSDAIVEGINTLPKVTVPLRPNESKFSDLANSLTAQLQVEQPNVEAAANKKKSLILEYAVLVKEQDERFSIIINKIKLDPSTHAITDLGSEASTLFQDTEKAQKAFSLHLEQFKRETQGTQATLQRLDHQANPISTVKSTTTPTIESPAPTQAISQRKE